VSPGVKIIQRIEDDIETGEPVDVELGVLDVRMVGLQLRAGPELARDLLGHLIIERATLSGYPQAQTECEDRRCRRDGEDHPDGTEDAGVESEQKRTKAFGFLMCSYRKRN